MDVAVRVLNQRPYHHDDLPRYSEHDQNLAIDLVIVSQNTVEGVPFDYVEARIQACVKTQVGCKSAVQKVFDTVETRSWSDFTTTYTTSPLSYSTKITYDLKGTKSAFDGILPTINLCGSTYITKSTALSDRQRIEGNVETHNWVNVILFRHGREVHQSRHPIYQSGIPRAVALLDTTPEHHCELVPSIRQAQHISRIFRSRKHPANRSAAAQMYFPDALLPIRSSAGTSGASAIVDIPVQISLTRLDFDCLERVSRDGLRFQVQARWYTRKAFGLSGADRQDTPTPKITRSAVSLQTLELYTPPFYTSEDSGDTASANSVLELTLPPSANVRTLHTDLLAVDYELELTSTLFLQGLSGEQPLKGTSKFSCILSA